jgi:hypothetical protein
MSCNKRMGLHIRNFEDDWEIPRISSIQEGDQIFDLISRRCFLIKFCGLEPAS